MSNQPYQKCIDACLECATLCNHCAVSCLEVNNYKNLTKCIRLNLECAVICRTSAELMALESAYLNRVCGLCSTICDACVEECEKHSDMEHCKECAEACRTCAKEAFIIFQDTSNKTKDTNPVAYQNECSILSRAAAELISLGSAWSLQISEINEIVCKAFANEYEKYFNFQMKQSREHSTAATNMHQNLLTQDKEKNDANVNEIRTKDQVAQEKKEGKRKRRHVSALLAASMARSATDYVRPHVTADVIGTSMLPNTGTVITYKED